VATKRMHDRNRSGWWLLLVYGPPAALAIAIERLHWNPALPVLGIALDVLVLPAAWAFVELFCLRGTPGPNRYGPEPKA